MPEEERARRRARDGPRDDPLRPAPDAEDETSTCSPRFVVPSEPPLLPAAAPEAGRRLSRLARASLVLLLAVHAALLVRGARTSSATYDEGPHLAAGMAYLRWGEFGVYNLSPPLLRMIAAAPAYWSGAVDVPPAKRVMDYAPGARHWVYFERFEDANPRTPRYVLWGRLVLMPFSLGTAVLIFAWARRLYGDVPALLACGAWCFSPTVVAVGSTLGTDTGTTFAMTLALWFWSRFLAAGTNATALAAAVTIGIAHAMKFTALVLWPALFLAAAATAIVVRGGAKARVRRAVIGLAVAAVVTFVVFNGSYSFKLVGDRLDRFDFQSNLMLAAQERLPGWLPVPFARHAVTGFDAQKYEVDGAYPNVLFGTGYLGSDWRYYPWVVASKTTVGGLALLVLLPVAFLARRPDPRELELLVYAGVVLAVILLARINIGIRYLLPVYPVVLILMGRLAVVPRLRVVAAVAAIGVAVEGAAASARPHSFCNLAVRPWSELVPDQDWGQSLYELKDWMAANRQHRIRLLYFGTIDPTLYGIRADESAAYVAISKNALRGLPCKARGLDFIFVRPWRRLAAATPVADLGGLVIFPASALDTRGGEEPIVVVEDLGQAMAEPNLIPMRDAPFDR